MPNETSTKSTTDCEAGAKRHRTAGAKRHHEVGAEHNCKAGAQRDGAVATLSERATRLQDRHPKLKQGEAAMICEVAANIVRYARRQEAEMAAVADMPAVAAA
mgnify:CR=1 FL=1